MSNTQSNKLRKKSHSSTMKKRMQRGGWKYLSSPSFKSVSKTNRMSKKYKRKYN